MDEQLQQYVGKVVVVETRYGWAVGKLHVSTSSFSVQPVSGVQFALNFMAKDVKRIDGEDQRIILK
jgi:hypothetical protein